MPLPERAAAAAPRTEAAQYLIHAAFVVAGVLAVLKRQVLPANFFFDEQRILLFIDRPGLVSQDGSYRGTAALLGVLGTSEAAVLAVTAASYIAFLVLLVRYVPVRRAARSAGTTVAVVLAAFLGAVFVAGYTKELLVVLLLLLRPRAPRSRWPEALWLGACVAYAIGVRQYWLLVVAVLLLLRATGRSNRYDRVFLVALPLIVAALVVIFDVILGVPLNHFRTSVVDGLQVAPGSVIRDPFPPTHPVLQWLNGMWGVAVLIVPLPLLGTSATQLATLVLVAWLWLSMFRGAAACSGTAEAPEVRRTALLCLAYLIVLSLFEPDFGSYLRHLTPMIPLILHPVLVAATAPGASDADGPARPGRPDGRHADARPDHQRLQRREPR